METVVGIDAGRTGGIAVLSSDGSEFIDGYDEKLIRQITVGGITKPQPGLVKKIIEKYNPVRVFLEQGLALPVMNRPSIRVLAEYVGYWDGAFSEQGIIVERIIPNQWKKWFGLKGKKDANSLAETRELVFSFYRNAPAKLKSGLADAILIARFGAMR